MEWVHQKFCLLVVSSTSPGLCCSSLDRTTQSHLSFVVVRWREVHNIYFFSCGSLLVGFAFGRPKRRVVCEEHFNFRHDRIELVETLDNSAQELFTHICRQPSMTYGNGILLGRWIVTSLAKISPSLDEIESGLPFSLFQGVEFSQRHFSFGHLERIEWRRTQRREGDRKTREARKDRNLGLAPWRTKVGVKRERRRCFGRRERKRRRGFPFKESGLKPNPMLCNKSI
ncbi:hypothetical protein Taro_019706 [Colocasia esculenta]|uniref:Uncharacterized protein n=1 Tax=Colocasia esculenta TaxID=4460 RepID=A0A843UUK4_COLES|nr:hypothetical protein [Colocasia esculenta]